MDATIRPLAAEELDAFVRSQYVAFGEHARAEDIENERLVFEADRSLGVFDGARLVGGGVTCTFEMTVPGGVPVPTAAVTSVGVQPTHRRRGLLTALMRLQLDDVRARGEPVAALWASEAPIYGRFGYGMAGPVGRFSLERSRSAFAVPVQTRGDVELIDAQEALRRFPAVYEVERMGRPGMMARNDGWWRYRVADPEHEREGFSEYFFAIHRTGGEDDAYAIYRVKASWEQGVPSGTLQVEELVAATPQANAEMWRYVLDHDLVATIEGWPRPVDDPLLHLLADPRRLRLTILDGLYVRMVDVPGALGARRYGSEGRLVLEVADPFCPWNEGRWALEGGAEGATCGPTDGEPDVALDATTLGATYLGGVTFGALARAGRVREGRDGAIRDADAMFGSELAPWCAAVF